MRQSNCSAPIPQPHGQPRGQMRNVCDKKTGHCKDGVLQNEGVLGIIQRGARKKYSDKKTGATIKKVMSPGARGWSQNNLTGA